MVPQRPAPADVDPAGMIKWADDDSRQPATIRSEPFTSKQAGDLLEQADRFNESLYGHVDESPIDPCEFTTSRGGVFLIAYRGARAIACGGLRRAAAPAPPGAAEVKRMYVVDDARRQGLARQVLAALEAEARRLGYAQVVLDTGAKQDAAHSLYESAGYRAIPGFTIYRDKPGNRAYGKALT